MKVSISVLVVAVLFLCCSKENSNCPNCIYKVEGYSACGLISYPYFTCSDYVEYFTGNELINGIRTFAFPFTNIHACTTNEFKFLVKLVLNDTFPLFMAYNVVSHGTQLDTIYLTLDSLNHYSHQHYSLDIGGLYPNLDFISIEFPLFISFKSQGSLSTDKKYLGDRLTQIYYEIGAATEE